MKQKYTDLQLVNQAVVTLIEKAYRAYAKAAWAQQSEDTRKSDYYSGKYLAYEKAINILTEGDGEAFRIIECPLYLNGRTLVAVNILGHGLYRLYSSGQTFYYVSYPDQRGTIEINSDKIGGDWIWLDPYRAA